VGAWRSRGVEPESEAQFVVGFVVQLKELGVDVTSLGCGDECRELMLDPIFDELATYSLNPRRTLLRLIPLFGELIAAFDR
jgi:hypothetical protein